MADPALRRTVRRSTALLLLPLSGLAIGTERFVWGDYYGATPPTLVGGLVYEAVPWLLLLGALGYLLVSGTRSALSALAVEPVEESDHEGASESEGGG